MREATSVVGGFTLTEGCHPAEQPWHHTRADAPIIYRAF
jgi:hypothetical protein